MNELPSVIPVFPLPNLVLFPGLKVPLHIFEPRYREMVAEVSPSHGIVGMVLLKGDWECDYHAYPDVFDIGCAGRIDDLVRLPDGRYNLMLEGVREFRIVQELRDRCFRQARVEWLPTESKGSEVEAGAMEALRGLLVRYVGDSARQAWDTAVKERGLGGPDLINFLCFYLDLLPIEKQTLLEALGGRLRCLVDILTFKLEERKLGPAGSNGGPGVVQ